MNRRYTIHLNFIAFSSDVPSFRIFRGPRINHQDPLPEDRSIRAYSFPISPDNLSERVSHLVSLSQQPSFEKLDFTPTDNRDIAKWAIFSAPANSAATTLNSNDFNCPTDRFASMIDFSMRQHPEGVEQLVVEPYYLRSVQKMGFVFGFHFRLAAGAAFDRNVQRLSLTLNSRFGRNFDFYIDRTAKIKEFVRERWQVLKTLNLPGATSPLALNRDFEPVEATRLEPKTYVFSGGRESKSQFNGLREHGPLQLLDQPPTLFFIFREVDRVAARRLATALRGSGQRERFGFPGFQNMFRSTINIDPNPVVVTDFSVKSMSEALDRTRLMPKGTLPLLIVPDNSEEPYLNYKSVFTHAGVPCQVCTARVIQDETTLKWSVGNIALQLFCKAGGLPWKVRPSQEHSLIIGISQSHRFVEVAGKRTIDKFFAFSVLTDSSGLFQKIQILGDSRSEVEYLNQLSSSLSQILKDYASSFSRVVVHTSFKLKYKEIDRIHDVVKSAADGTDPTKLRFAVVKVNHSTRFFGVNRDVNSLVPFEATKVRLGYGEYLLWFEGIFPNSPTVNKAFPGPTHIQMLRIKEEASIEHDVLLQDLVNLSGANWRGFNAKSAPVSVFYCHLVADLVHEFHSHGLQLPAVEDLKPWFL